MENVSEYKAVYADWISSPDGEFGPHPRSLSGAVWHGALEVTPEGMGSDLVWSEKQTDGFLNWYRKH